MKVTRRSILGSDVLMKKGEGGVQQNLPAIKHFLKLIYKEHLKHPIGLTLLTQSSYIFSLSDINKGFPGILIRV